MRNFEHYHILSLRAKFHFMWIFIWKHQIQPSRDMTRKCLKNKANGSVKCTRARKKQLKINARILKENVKEKSDCSFAYFFFNQYRFDSKKKKMEQYNHAEKLKNQF